MLLANRPLKFIILVGSVLAISLFAAHAQAQPAPPRLSGWPRLPKGADFTCFDRDTANLKVWTVTGAPECGRSTSAQPSAAGLRTDLSFVVLARENNKFDIRFACEGAAPETCAKAKAGFERAGSIISSALSFHRPVVVDAHFRSLGGDRIETLGSATTTRLHLLEDVDGENRLYPQSLVKQIMPAMGNLAGADIFAEFNSDANFWFLGDGPINASQHDFTYVVLHEMFHGLGFASSWRDYFNLGVLTPLPQGKPNATDAGFALGEFREFAFDRFVVDAAKNTTLSKDARTIRTSLGEKAVGGSKALPGAVDPKAASASVVRDALHGSGLAESQRLFMLAQTSDSLVFALPGGKDAVVLETSIIPYKAGSSVSHASAATSANTADFLMRFALEPGSTLQDVVHKCASKNPFGPIGPKLLKVMDALGYTVRSTPGSGIHDYVVAPAPVAFSSSATTSGEALLITRTLVVAAACVLLCLI